MKPVNWISQLKNLLNAGRRSKNIYRICILKNPMKYVNLGNMLPSWNVFLQNKVLNLLEWQSGGLNTKWATALKR